MDGILRSRLGVRELAKQTAEILARVTLAEPNVHRPEDDCFDKTVLLDRLARIACF